MESKTNVVAEALDNLKGEVTTQMETKASIESVKTVTVEAKEYTDTALEVFKAEQGERMNDLEAKLAAPAIITETKGLDMDILFTKTEFGFSQTFDITKAVTGNTNVPGGRVDTTTPFHTLEQMNPFRSVATIMPVSGGVMKLPSIGGISVASESAQPSAARTPGGTSEASEIIIERWVSENAYSLPNLEDVPMMDSAIVSLMSQEFSVAEAKDAVAVLKAATITAVNTGLAGALPSSSNLFGKLADMKATLSGGYRPGSMWIVSREVMALINKSASTNSPLNFDPVSGVQTLLGYPVMVIDFLDDGTSAGDNSAYFGNFKKGLVMGNSNELTVGRYSETRPGSMTYFGEERFKHAVWDKEALVSLNTAA